MRASRYWVSLAVWAVCGAAPGAQADPLAFCSAGRTDDTPRPLPESLAPQAARIFRLHHMPAGGVAFGTVMRCMNGQILICNHGANLPCGQAQTDPDLPQAASWCRTNRQANFIPAYITGHASIFHWRCLDGAPVHVGEAEPIDASGYIARYWKAFP
jgi:hypothetical protein